jgi:hypothetical protein
LLVVPPYTVAPVVVRPIMLSKKASAKKVRDPERMKGRAEKAVMSNQVTVTTRKASRARRSACGRKSPNRVPPIPMVMAAAAG